MGGEGALTPAQFRSQETNPGGRFPKSVSPTWSQEGGGRQVSKARLPRAALSWPGRVECGGNLCLVQQPAQHSPGILH